MNANDDGGGSGANVSEWEIPLPLHFVFRIENIGCFGRKSAHIITNMLLICISTEIFVNVHAEYTHAFMHTDVGHLSEK